VDAVDLGAQASSSSPLETDERGLLVTWPQRCIIGGLLLGDG
jgi:hypothetical protein